MLYLLHRLITVVVLATLAMSTNVFAAGEHLALHKVADGIYAIVGGLDNRTPQNLGNNATFGAIVTAQGVVLIDPGGTYRGAQHLAERIRTFSDQPVVVVINTGGQDHRWLGNEYFAERGASIIAATAAVKDQQARASNQLSMLSSLVGEAGIKNTEPKYADVVFERVHRLKLGGVEVEIHHRGQAHTPGDSFVWLPQSGVMFSGDIVYTKRMLTIGDQSDSKAWVQSFEALASFAPSILVPGHGSPTVLAVARADTLQYLLFLRKAVRRFMADGGDISDISSIDQSQFKRLANFNQLAGRNAQRVFEELEWE